MFVKCINKAILLKFPQFPQQLLLLLLYIFFNIYFNIRKERINNLIEFNLRKKYIVSVKRPKFQWILFVIKVS